MLETYGENLSEEVKKELEWSKRILIAKMTVAEKNLEESSQAIPHWSHVLSVPLPILGTDTQPISSPSPVLNVATEELQASSQPRITKIHENVGQINRKQSKKKPTRSNSKDGQRKLKI